MNDWLPSNHLELYKKVTGYTVPYLDAHLEEFGMKPGTPLGDWYAGTFKVEIYAPYVEAFENWSNSAQRTPISAVALRDAERILIPAYRNLYRMLKNNPLVENADLAHMGYPARTNGSRSPAPVAIHPPNFRIAPLTAHRLAIHYYRTDVKKRARPKGQRGVEIRWDFYDGTGDATADMNPETMIHSRSATTSPALFAFDPKEAGRHVCFALRWENTRGEKGPWSVIHDIHIC
ncbi:MAG: hypothetical protein LBS05_02570 [Tannerellaceae bacterium]|nr:hypothetical protein [Tannerellaceae bacterium]